MEQVLNLMLATCSRLLVAWLELVAKLRLQVVIAHSQAW